MFRIKKEIKEKATVIRYTKNGGMMIVKDSKGNEYEIYRYHEEEIGDEVTIIL